MHTSKELCHFCGECYGDRTPHVKEGSFLSRFIILCSLCRDAIVQHETSTMSQGERW